MEFDAELETLSLESLTTHDWWLHFGKAGLSMADFMESLTKQAMSEVTVARGIHEPKTATVKVISF